jgi:hypothetical protein
MSLFLCFLPYLSIAFAFGSHYLPPLLLAYTHFVLFSPFLYFLYYKACYNGVDGKKKDEYTFLGIVSTLFVGTIFTM